MTATGTTLTSPGAPGAAGRPVAAQVRPVTLGRVIRSEWINLRSLRSTVVVSALTVVIMVALGLLIPYFAWKNAGPIERAHFDAIDRSLAGWHLAVLTVGILGNDDFELGHRGGEARTPFACLVCVRRQHDEFGRHV